VRVCAGQSEFTAGGCRDLMVDGAIDVCNFDASWSGGPTEWRRVAGMALAFDVRMAHHEEPQVGSHLLASIPHGTFMETFQRDRDPIWWGLVANRPAIVDGHVSLTDTPGLGWELDWDFVERHRVAFPESGPDGSRRTP
jgi:L-alanine-DL-glutamate epimerase-like enolase superfamily enzyme